MSNSRPHDRFVLLLTQVSSWTPGLVDSILRGKSLQRFACAVGDNPSHWMREDKLGLEEVFGAGTSRIHRGMLSRPS